LIGLDLGGCLCTYDGDDGACPIPPDPHLITKGVSRDRPATCCRAVLGVEFPRASE
jgi:hypothetical protein